MVGQLLIRGMIVGLIAGLIAFGVARVWGEPQVAQAILIEQAGETAGHAGHSHGSDEHGSDGHGSDEHGSDEHDAGAAEAGGTMTMADGSTMTMDAHEAAHPELFSRDTQAGLGLLTGLLIYGAALGGLLALVFAFAWGRMGNLGPRGTALVLAALGFTALILVPGLKYPSNPPAVGSMETIVPRTQLFFGMIVLSGLAMVLSVRAARQTSARLGPWNSAILGGVSYAVAILVFALVLPAVDEVQAGFPGSLLWQFRLASLGIQAVLWAVLGLGFGYAAESLLMRRRGALNGGYRTA